MNENVNATVSSAEDGTAPETVKICTTATVGTVEVVGTAVLLVARTIAVGVAMIAPVRDHIHHVSIFRFFYLETQSVVFVLHRLRKLFIFFFFFNCLQVVTKVT